MVRSMKRLEGGDEQAKRDRGAQEAGHIPEDADPAKAGSACDGEKKPEDFVAECSDGNFEDALQKGPVLKGDRWEFVHGARSLAVTAMAGTVFVVLDFFDRAGPEPKRIAGIFGVYFCGVLLFVLLERWDYSKRRASMPVDRFGGGRTGLVLMAIVFETAGSDAAAGLGIWIACSAVFLGCWSDGAWIALTARRGGVSLWRAWWMMIKGGREARRQCWRALFGEGGR